MRKMSGSVNASKVSKYLASFPGDSRATLKRLREIIRTVVPDAEERISYGIPVFFHKGMLVGYGAYKDHCSFFVMSIATMERHKSDLKLYTTTKATIHFAYDKPVPAALVKKIVKARMEENEARARMRARD